MDEVPVEHIRKFASDFSEHLSTQKQQLLQKLEKEKKLMIHWSLKLRAPASSSRNLEALNKRIKIRNGQYEGHI